MEEFKAITGESLPQLRGKQSTVSQIQIMRSKISLFFLWDLKFLLKTIYQAKFLTVPSNFHLHSNMTQNVNILSFEIYMLKILLKVYKNQVQNKCNLSPSEQCPGNKSIFSHIIQTRKIWGCLMRTNPLSNGWVIQ